MGLNIAINKIHELTNGEKRVFEALKRAYSNVSHEVYIYVQVIMSGKRPDFIIDDKKLILRH